MAGNWPQLLSCPRLVDPVYAAWPKASPKAAAGQPHHGRWHALERPSENGLQIWRRSSYLLHLTSRREASATTRRRVIGHSSCSKCTALSRKLRYYHPGDVDWQRLPCRYAARGCRDRSQGGPWVQTLSRRRSRAPQLRLGAAALARRALRLEFAHPGDLDWDATARVQL